MTNRELMQMAEGLVGPLDKQRLFLLRTDGTPRPCPACKRPVNVFDAAGIDLDAYDLGHTKYDHRCPGCRADLEQVLPFIAGPGPLWHWQRKEAWLQEQLPKARAFDQQHHPDEQDPSA